MKFSLHQFFFYMPVINCGEIFKEFIRYAQSNYKDITNSNLFKVNNKDNRTTSADVTLVSLETVVRRCSVKKVFLEIFQNSQENTCVIPFLNKVAGLY